MCIRDRLSVGDPDFATPRHIIEKAYAAMLAGDTHYAPIAGRYQLRKAICDKFRAESTLAGVTPDHVHVFAGAQNALFAAALCLLSPGDEVLVLEPMYVTYEALLKCTGAQLIRIPADPGNGLRPDLDALADVVTDKSRALFYANPNNPSGVVMTHDELQAIADIARLHDLWVVSDEVYGDLLFEGQHRHIASLPNMAERTVTIASASKSYAMTGWRCGWMIAPRELIEHANNLGLCMLYGSPGFVQEATIEALLNGKADNVRMRDTYKERRDHVCRQLESVKKLRWLLPQAGMFMLLDIRDSGYTSHRLCEELFEQTGVTLLDASAFGSCLEGFVRMAFAAKEDKLTEGCERIAGFFNRIVG